MVVIWEWCNNLQWCHPWEYLTARSNALQAILALRVELTGRKIVIELASHAGNVLDQIIKSEAGGAAICGSVPMSTFANEFLCMGVFSKTQKWWNQQESTPKLKLQRSRQKRKKTALGKQSEVHAHQWSAWCDDCRALSSAQLSSTKANSFSKLQHYLLCDFNNQLFSIVGLLP